MSEVPASSVAMPREREIVRTLCIRSDARGLAQLALHALALVLTGVLVASADALLWRVAAMTLHGIVLVFLFAPLHETIHRTAFRSRRLNDLVARVCGLLLLLPPEHFRAFHFTHHRHTQDPDEDPELATPKPATLAGYLWHVSGVPHWRAQVGVLLRHAAGRVREPFIRPRLRATVVRQARVMLAIYGGIAVLSVVLGSTAALTFWVLPALVGQPFLRAYLLAEHTGCPLVADMLENSRTTRSLAVVRRLAWNMPYHAEHHALPAVPFHALPAAHALLKERIAVQAPGYVAVHREIVAGLGASASPTR